jgi:hypothetical protein
MTVAVALLLCALADPKPVLVLADPACFVHALRASADAGDVLERPVDPGFMLLHTARASGEMTVLVPATGTVARGTCRASFVQTRILGIAADAERLYVLLWSVRTWDRPPERDAPAEGGRYELRTFRLADGHALKAPALNTEGLPKGAPKESLGNGPLNLLPGAGVECYGTRAIYEPSPGQAAE